MNKRRLILYIAMSLDGFIADENDDLDFLNLVAKDGEDYGYNAFTDNVDAVIMGRRTYEKVRSMGVDDPHPGKQMYVLTSGSHDWPAHIHTYAGDPAELINSIRQQPGRDIYCDGGAHVVNQLRRQHLFDEYIISVIPVLLGNGIRLFDNKQEREELLLVSARSYDYGLVQLHYHRKV